MFTVMVVVIAVRLATAIFPCPHDRQIETLAPWASTPKPALL